MSLRMTITATEHTTHLDGVEVRLWEGVTQDGVPCKVFVHRIAVRDDRDASVFERYLSAKVPAGRHVPLSQLLD